MGVEMSGSLQALCDGMRLTFADPLTVTLTRPQSYSGGAPVSVTVNNVQDQFSAEQRVDEPEGGSFGTQRAAFRMWLVECGGLAPHQGCLITDPDGAVWHVDGVDVVCKGREYRCHCTMRPS
jgi:hypothetical protein